ncbi:speckle-type POZ protein B-like [Planococcus citri]|uniref:speckle-type POZ protein B-like n=1 Tax=Planococcus citri TaxID=170843 RepID=UPI0031F9A98F
MASFCKSVCKSNKCKTTIRSDTASYVWTIEDFHFHEAKGEQLLSSAFSSVTNNRVKWRLVLWPDGDTDEKDSIGLFIYLSIHSSIENNKKIFAGTTFYVVNSKGKEESKCPLSIREFSILTNRAGWGLFIKKDGEFRNKILSNNTLTIRCEVKFSDMECITTSTSSHQCDCGIKMPECNLSDNFASLIKNQTLTDVVLSVNGKEYPAHKAVLAARSPVFCAMFTHSTKESELNRVDIKDIEEAVVEEMLKYIYTGKCENLDGLAEGLLTAADKYDLCGLKVICAKKLIRGLSVENATNVLILADMHHYEDLKRQVIKFIVTNCTEVVNTEAWLKMLSSNSKLANEVCKSILHVNESQMVKYSYTFFAVLLITFLYDVIFPCLYFFFSG